MANSSQNCGSQPYNENKPDDIPGDENETAFDILEDFEAQIRPKLAELKNVYQEVTSSVTAYAGGQQLSDDCVSVLKELMTQRESTSQLLVQLAQHLQASLADGASKF